LIYKLRKKLANASDRRNFCREWRGFLVGD
jgi:hypothetical protein